MEAGSFGFRKVGEHFFHGKLFVEFKFFDQPLELSPIWQLHPNPCRNLPFSIEDEFNLAHPRQDLWPYRVHGRTIPSRE